MKIGPIELRCDFDASKDCGPGLWSPPINFALAWPGFRWSFGLDVTQPAPQCSHRWFTICLTPLDDTAAGPRWLLWRMGCWRLYWWFGFRAERANG